MLDLDSHQTRQSCERWPTSARGNDAGQQGKPKTQATQRTESPYTTEQSPNPTRTKQDNHSTKSCRMSPATSHPEVLRLGKGNKHGRTWRRQQGKHVIDTERRTELLKEDIDELRWRNDMVN
ncbi:hypothetical protein Taro_032945 [Colocasia esculenta]|uniref:Uncharacterized protein n=1 Tax=Colocasia esculenta TaxID=4460 RepID=A0A843VYP4_COLES|nr:hypothetical protein [Colocasia esculenta]